MTLGELHGNNKKWASQTAFKLIFETRGYPSRHSSLLRRSFPRLDAPECHSAAIHRAPTCPSRYAQVPGHVGQN
jgi:hypothetical protein